MLHLELEKAKNYGDIFALVKKAVKKSTGKHRVGLMLYLGNLPIKVGAFHAMGTNDIVINRRLLKETTSLRQKSHIFTILLHEYLHTLGYANESRVRMMTYRICKDNFPASHPVLESSINGPWADLSEEDYEGLGHDLNLERIRDFEKIDSMYII